LDENPIFSFVKNHIEWHYFYQKNSTKFQILYLKYEKKANKWKKNLKKNNEKTQKMEKNFGKFLQKIGNIR
jgi:hypothetical protein